MGFFKKLLKPKPLKTVIKQAIKSSSKTTNKASNTSYSATDLEYSVNLAGWLQGQSIAGTDLHRKHPDVRKKASYL